MIHDTLTKLETKLAAAQQLDESTRGEVERLMKTLHAEIDVLARTHTTGAGQITEKVVRVEAAEAHELQEALQSLSVEVTGFEQSHPKLTQLVNRISTTLANLGI